MPGKDPAKPEVSAEKEEGSDLSGTIVAVSTATVGAGGIGVVRMSGQEALRIAKEIFTKKGRAVESFTANYMTLGTVTVRDVKEKAFCVYFKAPLSFTGEDVIEFHCHGGPAVLNAVVEETVRRGAVPAARGEFSRRAFLNGKMTLEECEGMIDMIEAESTAELLQASRLMRGELGRGADEAASLLVTAASNLEAALDYPEEVLEDMRADSLPIIREAYLKIEDILATADKRRMVKEGATIAIAGSPNAGKSSLLNALLKEDRAIVSSVPGTTRDVLRESMEYNGVRLNFIDTAGIRESDDEIEREGVARAKTTVRDSDLTLLVADTADFNAEEYESLAKSVSGKLLKAGNKIDCGTVADYPFDVMISAKTGEGVEELLQRISEELDLNAVAGSAVVMRSRHIAALKRARDSLKEVLDGYEDLSSDCILVDLEDAAAALYEIQGKDVSAEVVDRVFERFCLGK